MKLVKKHIKPSKNNTKVKSIIDDLYGDHYKTFSFAENLSKTTTANVSENSILLIQKWYGGMKEHFREEERDLFPLIKDGTNDHFIEEILREHREFESTIDTIENSGNVKPETLQNFGEKLMAHIQKEDAMFERFEKNKYLSCQMSDKNETSNGKKGGMLNGKRHSECDETGCGIQAVVTDASGKRPVELEAGEIIITKPAVDSEDIVTIEGTPKQILSTINHEIGGGVKIGKGAVIKKTIKKSKMIYGGVLNELDPMLIKAKLMKEKHHSPIDILASTGWYYNTFDKKWRTELDDSNMKLLINYDQIIENLNKDKYLYKYEELVYYPELFKKYPEIKDIKIGIHTSPNIELDLAESGFNKDGIFIINLYLKYNDNGTRPTSNGQKRKSDERIKRLIGHETQHRLQYKHDFGGASGIVEAERRDKESLRRLRNRVRSIKDNPVGKKYLENKIADLELKIQQDLNQNYLSYLGEIEARDVDSRFDYTSAERKHTLPYSSNKIPQDKVIVVPANSLRNTFEKGGELKHKFIIIPNSQTPNTPKIHDVKHFIKTNKKELEEFFVFASHHPSASALSANQVSVNGKRLMYRVFAIDDNGWKLVINPTIEQYIGAKSKNHEECISWKNKKFYAMRSPEIKVSYYTIDGNKVHADISGYMAEVWQHEVDHLNGVKENVMDSTELETFVYENVGTFKNGGELAKGISVEEEHRNTLEKLNAGKINVDQAVKQIALDHISENPKYYDYLEEIEKEKWVKMKHGGIPYRINNGCNCLKFEQGGSVSEQDAKKAAQEFINSLSEKDLAEIKSKYNEIINQAILKEQIEIDVLIKQKEALIVEKKIQDEAKNYNEAPRIRHEIRIIDTKIQYLNNTVFAIKNGGDIVSFDDKKGRHYSGIPSFAKIKTDFISFSEDTILTDPLPNYIPLINEQVFAQKGYVFDAIRLDKDMYILATNGYMEHKVMPIYNEEKVETEDFDLGYVFVTLDQLALISDYYYKKAKSTEHKKAEESNKRKEDYYYKLPIATREKHFNQKGYYHSLPVSVKKKVTQSEWDSLSLEQKESYYKPFKRSQGKRLVSKLENDEMWTSFHKMYERFINPLALPIKKDGTPVKEGADRFGTFGNPEIFEYWHKFRYQMKWKIKDIGVQRQFISDMRSAALETSFGESNTDDILKEKYGILVKRQSGDKINPAEIEQIRHAWENVNKVFGNLVKSAKDSNLKISHTGKKLVFASKAAGMYIPDMHTIAVSDKFGDNQFESILAHESAHWIDNILGGETGKRYYSDDFENTAGMIADTLRRNMNEKSDSDYINATKECFARAMEQYFSIETFGDDASLIYSYTELDTKRPYFSEKHYVNKSVYESKLKPLIKKFFEENKLFFKYDIVPVQEINIKLSPKSAPISEEKPLGSITEKSILLINEKEGTTHLSYLYSYPDRKDFTYEFFIDNSPVKKFRTKDGAYGYFDNKMREYGANGFFASFPNVAQ